LFASLTQASEVEYLLTQLLLLPLPRLCFTRHLSTCLSVC